MGKQDKKQAAKEPEAKTPVQKPTTPKVIVKKEEVVEYEDSSISAREYFLFFLRIIAVFIIVAAFLNVFLQQHKHANIAIKNMIDHAMISNFAAKLADCYLPPLIRSVVIYGLGTAFGVNFKDVMFSLEHFTSWNEFFGRKIIPRPIDKTQFALLAPADSKLLSLQEITEDSTILVKSIRYSVGNFLTGEFGKVYNEQDLAKLRFKKNTKLFSLVFYLAPKDYHRFHSMANCTVFERVHVGGLLYPVKDSYLEIVPGVYEVNERVTLKGEWKWGNLIQSYVGATNVGTIQINLDPELNTRHTIDGPIVNNKLIGVDLQAGEEVGRFLMGSSVVAIVEVPNDFVWEVTVGQDVKYGMRIGH